MTRFLTLCTENAALKYSYIILAKFFLVKSVENCNGNTIRAKISLVKLIQCESTLRNFDLVRTESKKSETDVISR